MITVSARHKEVAFPKIIHFLYTHNIFMTNKINLDQPIIDDLYINVRKGVKRLGMNTLTTSLEGALVVRSIDIP